MNSAVLALQSKRALAAKRMTLAVLLAPTAEKMRDIAWQDRLRPNGRPWQTGIRVERIGIRIQCTGIAWAGRSLAIEKMRTCKW